MAGIWSVPKPDGGWPGPLNTGVPTGTSLTTSFANFFTSANNQTVDALDVGPFGIIVNHTGVTVKRCKAGLIKLGDSANADNFIVQDCEVSAVGGSGIWAVNGHDGQILRCKIHGLENFIVLSDGDRCLIQDNYMYDPIPYNPIDDPHTDGVQLFPGNIGVTIKHNFFNLALTGVNSCVTTQDVTNVTIDNCKMIGGTYNVYWEGTTTGCVIKDSYLDNTYSNGYVNGTAAASQTYTNNKKWDGTPLSLP